jgi:hypothetical protein
MAINGASSSTSGYSADTPRAVGGGFTGDLATQTSDVDYWSLSRCKRGYTDYLGSKRNEIQEQQEARRYRHGAHWTAAQIKTFNDRKQPVVTFNRIGRKLDGIVGVAESLRADPKAYPTSPKHQQGADLATAALRSALEANKFKQRTPFIAGECAIDGFGGIELQLMQQANGYEIALEEVDNEGFFYDPRSKKADFSDARYMGMGKWVDVDVAKDMLPDHAQELDDSVGDGADLTTNSDGDAIWFMPAGDLKSVRLVYICYRHRGGWCWALFTGAHKLMEGKSYFSDRHGKPICSFIMFCAAVDHDYDRYGFPRNLKSAQDEINQRRSKGLHELNTRRIIAEKGAFDDVEKARQEAVRPDGVVERNKGYEAEFDDAKKQQDIMGQLRFLEDAKAEIENFGPNPALMGDQGIANRSGRAIALMQKAGIAELGPYTIEYRNWKLRVYEAVFHAIKKYWTNERWIRVTDDDGIMQFVQINALQMGPMGMPQMVNVIGQLDVDIVLDEGPDTVTMMADMYETLAQIVPAIAPMLKPPEVQAVVTMLIETSPLSAQHKRNFRQAQMQSQQPDPLQAQAAQIQLAQGQAEVGETQSKTILNMAKAQAEGMPDAPAAPQMAEFEVPPIVQIEKALADIDKTRADAEHKRSQSVGEAQVARLAPIDYVQKAMEAAHSRAYDVADLRLRKYEADSARQAQARSRAS